MVCVDEVGRNSTASEITNAQLNTKFTDPVTGTTTTGMEQALRVSGEMGDIMQRPASTRQEIEASAAKFVFVDVPDGGDSAFAEAVCNELDSNVWNLLTSRGTPEKLLATTPHLLRGYGRQICGGIGDSYAEKTFEQQSVDAEAARADPEAFKQKQLDGMDANLARMRSAIAESSTAVDPSAADNVQKLRDDLAAQPAAELSASVQSMLRLQFLAVEHQCPQKSRFGVGPGCGPFNPFPDNGSDGVLRVRNGDLPCEDAKTVIRWHYFPSQANTRSPLSMYTCKEGGFSDEKYPDLFIECIPVQGNPNVAEITVAAR